jgi:hypothetical protein
MVAESLESAYRRHAAELIRYATAMVGPTRATRRHNPWPSVDGAWYRPKPRVRDRRIADSRCFT